jgi:hypothetical protein
MAILQAPALNPKGLPTMMTRSQSFAEKYTRSLGIFTLMQPAPALWSLCHWLLCSRTSNSRTRPAFAANLIVSIRNPQNRRADCPIPSRKAFQKVGRVIRCRHRKAPIIQRICLHH